MLKLYLALPLRCEMCIAEIVLLTSCLATESEASRFNISKIRRKVSRIPLRGLYDGSEVRLLPRSLLPPSTHQWRHELFLHVTCLDSTFIDLFNLLLSHSHDTFTPSHTTYHSALPSAHSTMSLLTPPPTGARPPPSELPVVLRFLNAHLEHGALQPQSYDQLYRVIQAIGEISLLLFPHSDSLDTVSSRRIETLADLVVDTLYAFGEHIDKKLWHAKRAMEELPNLAVRAEEKRQRNLRAWHKRLQ
jgi:transposase